MPVGHGESPSVFCGCLSGPSAVFLFIFHIDKSVDSALLAVFIRHTQEFPETELFIEPDRGRVGIRDLQDIGAVRGIREDMPEDRRGDAPTEMPWIGRDEFDGAGAGLEREGIRAVLEFPF